jgi:hypothetical protein
VATVLGWLVIAGLMALSSAAVLWPAFALLRRLWPDVSLPRWGYVLAIAAGGVATWHLIPVAVATLFSMGGPLHR